MISGGIWLTYEAAKNEIIRVPVRAKDECKPRCNPCIPPVGVWAYSYHDTHQHYPYHNHTHHLQMNQSPWPICKCFWNRNAAKVTENFSPKPGAFPVGEATGGGAT